MQILSLIRHLCIESHLKGESATEIEGESETTHTAQLSSAFTVASKLI